ncbi:MAG TPA: AMP-binding protein [Ramlibacter sp.]|nr:AMP-binding protein [Ramlibacter sp.]
MVHHASTPDVSPLRFGFPAGGIGDPATDPLPLAERVPAKILARQAARAPSRPFVFFAGRWITYGEADERANRAANALAAAGVHKGARVGVVLRNRLEFLDLWFGLSRLGAIQVPLNPEYRALQLTHVFKRAPIDVVVVEHGLLTEVESAVAELGTAPRMIVLDGAALPESYLRYEELLASAPNEPPAEAECVSGADVASVMNTSGTTGPSKGVLVSHAQQYILGRMIAADVELREDDVFYNFFPLFHNTAQAMITVPVLLLGARMVLTDRFSVSRFWPDIAEHRCTVLYYIGEIVRMLLNSTTQQDARDSTLRVGWGIGASPSDFTEFGRRYSVAMRTGYGSTEANVPCFLPHGAGPDSVGKCVPGFQVRIANDAGEPVPVGAVGEILVRSDEPCAVMMGYDGDPVATVAAWQNLWFHTGDAGCVDAEGNVYFKGRVKDAIRVRGENISAFEVEQVIGELHGVAEVAAIAVPSELGGDALKIVVVPQAGADLTHEALILHAEQRLPRYSIPRYIEFVAALPKTPTNKVQKNVLRAAPFTASTWERPQAARQRSGGDAARQTSN